MAAEPISIPRPVRCAIYTRKSTEEGLDQAFSSLDAQREAGEAYVQSQAPEGWLTLPDRYDDGGFTGANMERPALRRLVLDIEAGRIDCVIVYKVDRLSRSLLDFCPHDELIRAARRQPGFGHAAVCNLYFGGEADAAHSPFVC